MFYNNIVIIIVLYELWKAEISPASLAAPFDVDYKKKDNYNMENENIIKRGGEKKKIKNSNQYTMGILLVLHMFWTKKKPKNGHLHNYNCGFVFTKNGSYT